MPAKKRWVNLLPKTDFEASFWGKFLKWALTSGRYMVILTEMVVIIAFLSRFKLDKDLADLSDSISGKKAILDAAASTEREFLLVQDRLNTANKLITTQMRSDQILDRLTSKIPEGMRIVSLTLEKGELTLNSLASNPAFATFMGRITADRSFTNLNLATIAYDSTAGVRFTLKANY